MERIPENDPMENRPHLAGLDPADLLRQGAAEDTILDGSGGGFVPPPMEELSPLFPQFEFLALVGRGGMGAVYKVRQKELDRLVALKILPPSSGDEERFSKRFAREAKALAKLNHPGIVTLHEFGQQEGFCFIVMEFVDGVNLRQLMQSGRISSREALAIVPQICDALQFAHDQGIVHRDIKPENILLDRLGRVKVADFGIAKLVGAEDVPLAGASLGDPWVTEAGNVVGTPQYMAPEQIEHPADVDHRADIYALGVVFYQMLTGEFPEKQIEAPSKKVRIDVRLDEVVLQALAANPEMRFQTAVDFRTAVDGAGMPAEKRSPEGASGKDRGKPSKKADAGSAEFTDVVWLIVPFVAAGLALFNPWGGQAWVVFGIACAVIALFPISWRSTKRRRSDEAGQSSISVRGTRAIRRWWWVLPGMMAFMPLAALNVVNVWVDASPEIYNLVGTVEPENRAGGARHLFFKGRGDREIKSRGLLERVAGELELPRKWRKSTEDVVKTLDAMVSASPIDGSDVLMITVRHPDRDEAYEILETFARDESLYSGVKPVMVNSTESRVREDTGKVPVTALAGALILSPAVGILLIILLQKIFPPKVETRWTLGGKAVALILTSAVTCMVIALLMSYRTARQTFSDARNVPSNVKWKKVDQEVVTQPTTPPKPPVPESAAEVGAPEVAVSPPRPVPETIADDAIGEDVSSSIPNEKRSGDDDARRILEAQRSVGFASRFLDLVTAVAGDAAAGIGERHPTRIQNEKNLEEFRKAHPELPDIITMELATQRASDLELKTKTLRESGLAEQHPSLAVPLAQIAALRKISGGLPGESGEKLPVEEAHDVQVKMKPGGKVMLDGEEMTIPELEDRFKKLSGKRRNLRIQLGGMNDIPYADVLRVFDACSVANAADVSFSKDEKATTEDVGEVILEKDLPAGNRFQIRKISSDASAKRMEERSPDGSVRQWGVADEIIICDRHIQSAGLKREVDGYRLMITLHSQGAARLSRATENPGDDLRLAVIVGDKIHSAPVVRVQLGTNLEISSFRNSAECLALLANLWIWKDAAAEEILPWMALLDGGKYDESYDGMAAWARGMLEKAQLAAGMVQFRKPLGNVVSRRTFDVQEVKSMPGMPDGEYRIIIFTTDFENKKGATEVVSMMREADGRWSPAGYLIK